MRGDPNTPSKKMVSLHQLLEAELRNEEELLPLTIHLRDPGLFGRKKLILLLRWILALKQIAIHPNDQENMMFTCPFGIFAFRRKPFRLCNAPAKYHRCMTVIFSDFLGDSLEVFMDNFSIFGKDFESCLAHLTKILEVCVTKRLVLSREKSHFMVREGVVLGHLVSGKGLEVIRPR